MIRTRGLPHVCVQELIPGDISWGPAALDSSSIDSFTGHVLTLIDECIERIVSHLDQFLASSRVRVSVARRFLVFFLDELVLGKILLRFPFAIFTSDNRLNLLVHEFPPFPSLFERQSQATGF